MQQGGWIATLVLVTLYLVGILEANAAPPTSADSRKVYRLALVIGNTDYKHPKDPWTVLNSPKKDADDIGDLLQDSGYKVQRVYDGEYSTMRAQTIRFLNRVDEIKADIIERRAASQESIVALFYFSGHGFSRNGQLYMAAVDGKGKYIEDLTSSSMLLDEVSDRLFSEQQVELLSFLFLDACRDTIPLPSRLGERGKGGAAFKGSLFRGVSGSGGVVLFSSSDGKPSIDGKKGENSIFTRAFIATAKSTDESLGIYGFLNSVALATKKLSISEGFAPQVPELRGSPLSDVRFKGLKKDGGNLVSGVQTVAIAPAPEKIDIKAADSKVDSNRGPSRNGWIWLGNHSGDAKSNQWVRATFKGIDSIALSPSQLKLEGKFVATASMYMRESFPDIANCKGKVPASGNYAECTKNVGVLNTGESFKLTANVRPVPIPGKNYTQYWAQVLAE